MYIELLSTSLVTLLPAVRRARRQLMDGFSHIRKLHAITVCNWRFHVVINNILPDITVTAEIGVLQHSSTFHTNIVNPQTYVEVDFPEFLE
jgi:hypothetical protein